MARLGARVGPVASPGDGRVLLLEAAYEGLGAAVERIFETFPLPLRGSLVLVKPNILGPYTPDRAVTTHPALVAAVVDRLLAAGARVIVGDNPGARGYGANALCGRITGIAGASRGCFANLGAHPVSVRLGEPVDRPAMVSREVLEADLVVSLPKLKTHVQTIITCGVKNAYGYLVGGEKSRFHALAPTPRVFGATLAVVFAVRPPDLTIVDAVTAMEGDGPSSGRPRHVGLLIASRDAVAADHVAARLVCLDPARLWHLHEAEARGLGRPPGEVGPLSVEPVAGFALPSTRVAGVKTWLANRLVFSFLRRNRLRFRAEKCTGCGTCVEACPVEAIVMVGGLPRVDRRQCIACYCCHELCPHGAVELDAAMAAIRRLGRGGVG